MMSLADLIKKRATSTATANSAKTANDERPSNPPLARIATLAIANAGDGHGPIHGTTGRAVTAISQWWRFHYVNRDPKESSFSPAATYAEAVTGEPDAIKAEPFEPLLREPHAPLSQEEETVLLDWLERINETDEAMISAMLQQCQTDQDARDFFLGLARNNREG
jgi:hypothetical protein